MNKRRKYSPEEEEFMQQMGREFAEHGFPDFAPDMVEFQRKRLGLCIALGQLQKIDGAAYAQVVALVREDFQSFLDGVNKKRLAEDPLAEHFDANLLLSEFDGLASNIVLRDKYMLREKILKRLHGNRNAANLIEVLEEIQADDASKENK